MIAKEVVLTGKGGQSTNQSLDYIFQYTPKTLSKYYDTMKVSFHFIAWFETYFKGLSDKSSSRLSVVEGGTSVEKFLVEGHRFTQLSDHYGVKATLQYSQNI